MQRILERHKSIFQNLIGSSVEYAIIPELTIDNSAVLPEGNCEAREYGHFFHSYTIYLRCEKDGRRKWIKVSPGPDEVIEPWAPIWIECIDKIDYDSITTPLNHWMKEADEYEKQTKKEYFDLYVSNNGFSRINSWGFKDAIKEVQLLYYHEYCLCVFIQASGFKWSIYCEFDFWINFDQKLADRFLHSNDTDDIYIIK